MKDIVATLMHTTESFIPTLSGVTGCTDHELAVAHIHIYSPVEAAVLNHLLRYPNPSRIPDTNDFSFHGAPQL